MSAMPTSSSIPLRPFGKYEGDFGREQHQFPTPAELPA
jgi:hypothetical protein